MAGVLIEAPVMLSVEWIVNRSKGWYEAGPAERSNAEKEREMSDAFPVTVFHNPACGTSRNVLAMVEAAGYRPEVVDYVRTGWTADQLGDLFAEAGLTPRAALREKEAAGIDSALLNPATPDDAILHAMLAHPVLVNRPIVRTPRGAALCRPSEKVFDLLDRRPERFVKEDGEVVELG